MGLGYSFQPDEAKRLKNQLNQSAPTTQQALQVMSLRLPNVLGGHPITPEDLLRSMGGNGPGAVVSSMLGAGGAPAPPPRISPPTGATGAFGVLQPGSESAQLGRQVQSAQSGPGTPNFTPGTPPHDGHSPEVVEEPPLGSSGSSSGSSGSGGEGLGNNPLFELINRTLNRRI